MKIKFIPTKIKKVLVKNQCARFQIKGYKKISAKKISIVEFTNKNRIWVLKEEIQK
uniref:ORF87-like protein n=1 Tax=Vertebrata lanosa TaxID=1261582 RepID=A0A0B5W2Q0_9FLOR|nr:ORF87-like protein [Vertebrata lanosa]AJH65939.1 ORF87-like protein [Vertebrata lanosa]